MNDKYWQEFYKKKHIQKHSQFAEFCLQWIDPLKSIVDLGCGNGRDTYFFARRGIQAIGVDKNFNPKNKGKASFQKIDCNQFNIGENEQFYARFFLHAIEHLEVISLIDKFRGLIMFEFRHIEDKPLKEDHKRNLLDGRCIFHILFERNYNILFYSISRDVAKYKKENPIICRIIAKKY